MLVRLASRYPPPLVGQALDECWRRNMTDPVRLARFLEGEGRGARGARVMRRLVKERQAWSEVTDSEMESLFLRLAEKHRLVPDQSHVVIYDGKRRIKEVDFVYVGRKLVIELDSYKHHSGLDSFDHDREVDVVLERLGWRVLRFTWRQLNEKPDWVFSEIRSALGMEPLSPAS